MSGIRYRQQTDDNTSTTSRDATIVVWAMWNDSWSGTSTADVTSTAASDVNIWGSWNETWSTTSHITIVDRRHVYSPHRPRIESAESIREREAADRTWRESQEAARAKAEALLRATLDKKQNEDLDQKGWFLVDGKSGKRYRIERGRSGNVRLLNSDGSVRSRHCAHPQICCPDADTMLTQKLMLETDDQEFLRIANQW